MSHDRSFVPTSTVSYNQPHHMGNELSGSDLLVFTVTVGFEETSFLRIVAVIYDFLCGSANQWLWVTY